MLVPGGPCDTLCIVKVGLACIERIPVLHGIEGAILLHRQTGMEEDIPVVHEIHGSMVIEEADVALQALR